MSGRQHTREFFFKYTSLETAMKVVASKSFRWSAPTKFNDPFDHQSGFILDPDVEKFARELASSNERLIFGDFVPQSNSPSLLTLLGLELRRVKDRLPREQLVRRLHESCTQLAENPQEHIEKFNAAILDQLCHSRVFCVSEDGDQLVMWSHYSEEHRGVVFKLRCIDELDNVLLAAQPVSYTNSFLNFPSAEAYAKHLTGEQPIDYAPLILKIAFTKHSDWAYEKEWRVHRSLLNEPPGDGYNLYLEHPEVFESVYLGCRMDQEGMDRVVKAIRLDLPNTKIYRAVRSSTSFDLSFVEL